MQKIAAPQHLAIHLRRLLAYTKSPNPSRELVAQELRLLAREVAPMKVDWKGFQGDYLNPIGKMLHTGRTYSWEEVDAKKMGEALRMAAQGAGQYADQAGVGPHFKTMADRFGQAGGMLRKGRGGSSVGETLTVGWQLKQFAQLIGEGLKAAVPLRRQLDA